MSRRSLPENAAYMILQAIFSDRGLFQSVSICNLSWAYFITWLCNFSFLVVGFDSIISGYNLEIHYGMFCRDIFKQS